MDETLKAFNQNSLRYLLRIVTAEFPISSSSKEKFIALNQENTDEF